MKFRASKPSSVRVAHVGSTLDFAAFSADWRRNLSVELRKENPAFLLKLLAIVEITNPISQADLRRALDINQPRLSKLIAKLLAARLLAKVDDYYDRGKQLLEPTKAGMEMLRLFEPRITKADIEVLAAGVFESQPYFEN